MEDRALLGSNSSAATVQGHGRCPDGIAYSFYHASGIKRKIPGDWGRSPQRLEENVSNRMARNDCQHQRCTLRVNAPINTQLIHDPPDELPKDEGALLSKPFLSVLEAHRQLGVVLSTKFPKFFK